MASNPTANKAEAGDSDAVCKHTPVAGSRFYKKVCMTEREWEAIERDSRDWLERTQKVGTYGIPRR